MNLIIGYIMDAARWLVILVLAFLYPQSYSAWVGKVVGVTRADEITVQRNGKVETVRLYGIDAPIWWKGPTGARVEVDSAKEDEVAGHEDTVTPRTPVPQNYGQVARGYVRKRVMGKPVVVQPLPGRIVGPWYRPTIKTHDRHNRIQGLVHVYGEPGEPLNKELLRKGLAWWYQPFVPFERGFKHLQDEAREARVGLWADPHPMPPWRWQGTPIRKDNPWQKERPGLHIYVTAAVLVALLALVISLSFRIVRRFRRKEAGDSAP